MHGLKLNVKTNFFFYYFNESIFFQAKSDVGGRWLNGQSDVETDYRREMAVSEADYRREIVGSVHSEARGRDGGRRETNPPPSIYQQAATLSSREIEISQVNKFNYKF